MPTLTVEDGHADGGVLEDALEHRLAALQPVVHAGLVEREARLHREQLQQLAGVLVGPQPVNGQVDRQHAEQAAVGAVQRGEQRVLRPPGALVVGARQVRHPHGAGDRDGGVGEAQRADGLRRGEQLLPGGQRGPGAEQLGAHGIRAGDGDHLEVAVGGQQVEHGDPEADQLHDGLSDLVERAVEVQGATDPAGDVPDEAGHGLPVGPAALPGHDGARYPQDCCLSRLHTLIFGAGGHEREQNGSSRGGTPHEDQLGGPE